MYHLKSTATGLFTWTSHVSKGLENKKIREVPKVKDQACIMLGKRLIRVFLICSNLGVPLKVGR